MPFIVARLALSERVSCFLLIARLGRRGPAPQCGDQTLKATPTRSQKLPQLMESRRLKQVKPHVSLSFSSPRQRLLSRSLRLPAYCAAIRRGSEWSCCSNSFVVFVTVPGISRMPAPFVGSVLVCPYNQAFLKSKVSEVVLLKQVGEVCPTSSSG